MLNEKTVLFGFYSCAGKKKENTINSINKNKIIIGRIDNKNINNEFINNLFKDIKINLVIENKMDDYLKSHLASVLPLVYASYKVNGNLKLLKHDKKYSLMLIDAMLELYEVLISLNYEIIPYSDYLDYKNKKKLSALIYRLIFATFIGKMCISDHAMSAKDEFILLTEEFNKLIEKSNKETPLFNLLKEELYKLKASNKYNRGFFKYKKTRYLSRLILNGASDGNRTRILTLARLRSTTELHLQCIFNPFPDIA